MAYAQVKSNRSFGKTNPALTLTHDICDGKFYALIYRVKSKWSSHVCTPASKKRFMREYQECPRLARAYESDDPTDPTDDELPF